MINCNHELAVVARDGEAINAYECAFDHVTPY